MKINNFNLFFSLIYICTYIYIYILYVCIYLYLLHQTQEIRNLEL